MYILTPYNVLDDLTWEKTDLKTSYVYPGCIQSLGNKKVLVSYRVNGIRGYDKLYYTENGLNFKSERDGFGQSYGNPTIINNKIISIYPSYSIEKNTSGITIEVFTDNSFTESKNYDYNFGTYKEYGGTDVTPVYKLNDYYISICISHCEQKSDSTYLARNVLWLVYSTDLINWTVKKIYSAETTEHMNTNIIDYSKVACFGMLNNKLLYCINTVDSYKLLTINDPTSYSLTALLGKDTTNANTWSYGIVLDNKRVIGYFDPYWQTSTNGIDFIAYSNDDPQSEALHSNGYNEYPLLYNQYLICAKRINHIISIYNISDLSLVKKIKSKYMSEIYDIRFIIDNYIYCKLEGKTNIYRANIHDLLGI
jgi:hypothetical protein